MVKALIFDIDNTLYSYDKAHAVAIQKLYDYAQQNLGLDPQTLDQEQKAAAAVVKQHLNWECAALHNRTMRWQMLMEKHGFSLEHALTMGELYWDTLIGVAEPEPGAIECLTRLKEAGYVLGVGTDMTLEYQLKKLKKLQMLPLFDFLVSSEEVNIEKPDPKVFLTCAEKADVSPEACLFVGDSMKKDVMGPRAVGMQSLWYCPNPEKVAQHPEIDSITHFDQLLLWLAR